MPFNACTPDNVIGRLMAEREALGLDIPAEVIDDLDAGGKGHLVKSSNELDAQPLKDAGYTASDDAGLKQFDQKHENLVGRILADQKRPSHFAPQLVDDLNEVMTELYQEAGGDLASVRKEYTETVSQLFDEFDTSGMTPAQQNYLEQYRRYMVDEGGSFYSQGRKTGIGQGLANLADNVIKSSFTVALGNPLEVAIKAPALYADELGEGLSKWLQNGEIFKKLPELDELGYYSIERKSDMDANLLQKINNSWAGVNEYLDIPWKNLVYRIGEARGGQQGGLKAIDDILFIPRFADVPRQRWADTGRLESRFLSYSVSSARLGIDLVSRAAKGDKAAMKSLAIMAGATTALGGPGALLPEPLFQALNALEDGSGDELKENIPSWGGADLIRFQGIGRIGIPIDMANKQGQKAGKLISEGTGKITDGDTTGGLIDVGVGLMALTAFTQLPVGDVQFQKAIQLGRDVLTDELSVEDLPGEAVEKFLPFTRK